MVAGRPTIAGSSCNSWVSHGVSCNWSNVSGTISSSKYRSLCRVSASGVVSSSCGAGETSSGLGETTFSGLRGDRHSRFTCGLEAVSTFTGDWVEDFLTGESSKPNGSAFCSRYLDFVGLSSSRVVFQLVDLLNDSPRKGVNTYNSRNSLITSIGWY